jgi:lipopolysaccharide export system permease protein
MWQALLELGLYVNMARPPATPAGTFLLRCSLWAMLLVLDRMRRLFEFVATEGGPVSVVWRMLANLLPEYLGLGIPIGLMLGILLAFRKLATSSELDVFRAVGLSYTRLLRVPFMYAIALAISNLAIVGYIQPARATITSSCASSCARARSARRSRSASSPISATR